MSGAAGPTIARVRADQESRECSPMTASDLHWSVPAGLGARGRAPGVRAAGRPCRHAATSVHSWGALVAWYCGVCSHPLEPTIRRGDRDAARPAPRAEKTHSPGLCYLLTELGFR